MKWFHDLVPSPQHGGHSRFEEDESDRPVFQILTILAGIVLALIGVVDILRNIKDYL